MKSGGNFTEVLVRGAGHLVPMDKPSEALELVSTFIQGRELPLPFDYRILDNPPLNYEDDTIYSKVSNSKGLVASIVLNVIFVVLIVLGIVYAIRWKRRHDNYFYTLADNSSLNGVLTMD